MALLKEMGRPGAHGSPIFRLRGEQYNISIRNKDGTFWARGPGAKAQPRPPGLTGPEDLKQPCRAEPALIKVDSRFHHCRDPINM